VRSFDLSAGDSDACGCAHHGTPRCCCQYSILLVYPPSGAPVVVTAHGREFRTRLEIAADPNAAPPTWLVEQVAAILTETGLSGEPARAEAAASAA
jgi:hypothetical protein